MQEKKKILLVTPRFPYPEAGACEQDRADGIRQLKRLGYEVKVIGKFFDWQNQEEVVEFWKKENVEIIPVPYIYGTKFAPNKFKKYLYVLTHPWYVDGSVLEYTEPNVQKIFEKELDNFKPDYVWLDYTYLWPLYKFAKKRSTPILVRSINFEAFHFLDEDGRSLINYLKFIPKYFTEVITAKVADVLFSITPKELKTYKKLRREKIYNLPIRAMYKKLDTHTPKEKEKLHIFFSGSTYNVSHNRHALEFIIKEVAPMVYKKFGNQFQFHITGNKFPEDLKNYLVDNVVYEGFVDDIENFLAQMDIAIVPSLRGAGMQQKIFEPLARGFPTITHERGVADYDYTPGEDVLVGVTPNDFVDALEELISTEKRKKLSENAKAKSKKQFSIEVLDNTVKKAIEEIN